MLFGGIQKTSLIDYPDLMAAVLFTVGCNFRCPYCHNPGLVEGEPETRFDEHEALSFLKSRRRLLDAVVVSGGEPTLQPDLLDFLAEVRALGFLVKLDTNGSRPGVLGEALSRGLVDYAAMDVKTLPELYPTLALAKCPPENIRASIRIFMEWGGDYEFRTTCAAPLVSAEILGRLAGELHGAKRWALQKFVPRRVLDPSYAEGDAHLCGRGELARFREMVAGHVGECLVRE
jgi:pyruvate formate lyase activating enzyme